MHSGWLAISCMATSYRPELDPLPRKKKTLSCGGLRMAVRCGFTCCMAVFVIHCFDPNETVIRLIRCFCFQCSTFLRRQERCLSYLVKALDTRLYFLFFDNQLTEGRTARDTYPSSLQTKKTFSLTAITGSFTLLFNSSRDLLTDNA